MSLHHDIGFHLGVEIGLAASVEALDDMGLRSKLTV
jgi:hypothetical protein